MQFAFSLLQMFNSYEALSCRSVSDVPIKIQQLAITISNTKSVYKIMAQQWMEIDNEKSGESDSGENPFGTDFMMHPDKLYKISFAGEQCQFSENSMLSVSKAI